MIFKKLFRIKYLLVGILLVAVFLPVRPNLALAQDEGYEYEFIVPVPQPQAGGGEVATSATSIPEYINLLYLFGLAIGGIAAFGALVYGGFLWTTSGVSGKKGQAKSIISNALLGVAILVLSYIMLHTINPDLVGPQELAETTKEIGTEPSEVPLPDEGSCSNITGEHRCRLYSGMVSVYHHYESELWKEWRDACENNRCDICDENNDGKVNESKSDDLCQWVIEDVRVSGTGIRAKGVCKSKGDKSCKAENGGGNGNGNGGSNGNGGGNGNGNGGACEDKDCGSCSCKNGVCQYYPGGVAQKFPISSCDDYNDLGNNTSEQIDACKNDPCNVSGSQTCEWDNGACSMSSGGNGGNGNNGGGNECEKDEDCWGFMENETVADSDCLASVSCEDGECIGEAVNSVKNDPNNRTSCDPDSNDAQSSNYDPGCYFCNSTGGCVPVEGGNCGGSGKCNDEGKCISEQGLSCDENNIRYSFEKKDRSVYLCKKRDNGNWQSDLIGEGPVEDGATSLATLPSGNWEFALVIEEMGGFGADCDDQSDYIGQTSCQLD